MYKIDQDIAIQLKNIPELDPGFISMEAYIRVFEKTAKKRIVIAVVGNEGMTYCYDTRVHGSPEMEAADNAYAEVIVKFLIWS
ncbi:MAG TPA: hypothetical protein VEA58_08340, partial [Anaerovoracaceae bacterium]|nr:hypothetical protein [Anaerovoracaceae bacterium]